MDMTNGNNRSATEAHIMAMPMMDKTTVQDGPLAKLMQRISASWNAVRTNEITGSVH
jgi:hypothetical protein